MAIMHLTIPASSPNILPMSTKHKPIPSGKKSGRLATTNTAEGFFGNSKRSIDGTHHHVSGKYLPFYLAELDYKYNARKMTDGARTVNGIPRLVGRRLMLRRAKQMDA